MEHTYQTSILININYCLLRIAVLKAEMNDLYLEKELLLSRDNEMEHHETIKHLSDKNKIRTQ